MNAKEFSDLVSQMRYTQKVYFKSRDPLVLQKSKDLEKLVDKEIDELTNSLQN